MSEERVIVKLPNALTFGNQRFTAMEQKILYVILEHLQTPETKKQIENMERLSVLEIEIPFAKCGIHDYNRVRETVRKLFAKKLIAESKIGKYGEEIGDTPFPNYSLKESETKFTLSVHFFLLANEFSRSKSFTLCVPTTAKRSVFSSAVNPFPSPFCEKSVSSFAPS